MKERHEGLWQLKKVENQTLVSRQKAQDASIKMSMMDRFRKPQTPQTQYFEFGKDAASKIDELIKAVKANGDSQVLTAINNLTKMVKENFMGLKEDNEALTERMGRIDTAVDLIAADVAALKTELEEANERANIDLSPLIARAEGLEARLTGIAGPNAGTDPTAPPPVEPPAEPPVEP